MLKKFGLVAMGVTAGLVGVAPLATAQEQSPSGGDCSSQTDENGNVGQVDTCNLSFQHFGQGNTLNGVPLPAPPINEVPVN